MFFIFVCRWQHDALNHNSNKLLSKILANLRLDLKDLLVWSTVNSLKPHPGKFQYMIFGICVTNQLSFFIKGIKVERTSEVLLLGITIDDQLTFKTHIDCIRRVTKYKLRALQRITHIDCIDCIRRVT